MNTQEEEDIVRRMNEVVAHFHNGNQTDMSRKVGLLQVSVRSWLLQKNAVPLKFVVALINNYPIRAEWLLRGEGEMLEEKSMVGKAIDAVNKFVGCGNTDYYEHLLDMRDARIRELEREVAMLRSSQQIDNIRKA